MLGHNTEMWRTGKQISGQSDRQAGRRTDRQTDKSYSYRHYKGYSVPENLLQYKNQEQCDSGEEMSVKH